MKNLITLITIGILFFSCSKGTSSQTVDSKTREELYYKIASDLDFGEYNLLVKESAINIASNKYDLEAIGNLIRISGSKSFCQYEDEKLSKIRGGLDYKRIDCQISIYSKRIKQKFPEYFSFTTEERKIVHDLYRKIQNENTVEEIINSLPIKKQ